MATSEPSPPSIDTSPISEGRVSITPNLLSNQQVEALLEDAKGLHRNGAFVPGGLRRRKNNRDGSDMTSTTDATTRICDICGLFDDAEKAGPSVGNMDAREELLDLMADLRELLQTYLGIRLSKGMELQYLRYPGISDGQSGGVKQKGFYGRHFDRDPEDESCSCKRKVSLLLYLNTETWDAKKDGGVLRAYMPQKQQQKQARGKTRGRSGIDGKGATHQDIVPKGGTLVLFDSASVEHEVLPTHRERWAVVGWFLEDEDDNRVSMKRKKSDAKQHSRGDQQQRRRKKKKRRRKGEGT
ncbi:hypothetical protein THAOC_32357 [Thalassiosira oceanica]|uniref:Fe2OG dioxygenase domain-containing protein n=1 Tax=Thalassiosira oceanica TaxID=159749 RepID=K0R9D1_THAOC|nr:hypothetical protein THAOC_32357 [Thalassiosira oceanica]|eukprot:EJK48814.1 hypothetical protein THAOC_32357 [Thalassiosira oceanica]